VRGGGRGIVADAGAPRGFATMARMCLIAFAWRAHPRYRLALIANRDEFHARPAAPAGFDPEQPDVFGGRDLQAGGGWLLASTRGRLAAVTNVRAGVSPDAAPRSRGALVRGFAGGNDAPQSVAAALQAQAAQYGRFNLLLWEGAELVFATNHPAFATLGVAPGIHAMSNGAFDEPWPKAMHATRALQTWLGAAMHDAPHDAASLQPLFAALRDDTPAPDALLPDTGVGLERERRLSPTFVTGAAYGTRCSSVVLVEEDGTLLFAEQRYGPHGADGGRDVAQLRWARRPSAHKR
jgi:uncharacterized protein with NRDE domain